jgi:hypothetical protein
MPRPKYAKSINAKSKDAKDLLEWVELGMRAAGFKEWRVWSSPSFNPDYRVRWTIE